jgi:hypothetical protein
LQASWKLAYRASALITGLFKHKLQLKHSAKMSLTIFKLKY